MRPAYRMKKNVSAGAIHTKSEDILTATEWHKIAVPEVAAKLG